MTTETGTKADDLDLFAEDKGAKAEPKSHVKAAPSDKYEGKSVDEIIEMHRQAERKIGEQGQELGTLRRVVDHTLELRKPNQDTPKKEERPAVTVESLLNDPEKALKGAIDHEVTRRLDDSNARVASLEAQITRRDFAQAYPTYAEDAKDPEFISWVQKNPLRQALGNEAARENFVAAKNLWDLYSEYKEIVGTKTEASHSEPKRSVPSGVKSSPKVQGDAQRKYSRSKLMELRMKVQDGDPVATERWKDPAFQANLIKAYEDGRVV